MIYFMFAVVDLHVCEYAMSVTSCSLAKRVKLETSWYTRMSNIRNVFKDKRTIQYKLINGK